MKPSEVGGTEFERILVRVYVFCSSISQCQTSELAVERFDWCDVTNQIASERISRNLAVRSKNKKHSQVGVITLNCCRVRNRLGQDIQRHGKLICRRRTPLPLYEENILEQFLIQRRQFWALFVHGFDWDVPAFCLTSMMLGAVSLSDDL